MRKIRNKIILLLTLLAIVITSITGMVLAASTTVKFIVLDKNNNEIGISGIIFKIYDDEENLIDTVATDENGEAVSNRMSTDTTYIIRQIPDDKYFIEGVEQIFRTPVFKDKISMLYFYAEHKKGSINIVKVDKDDNSITLSGVEFDLIDNMGEIIQHLITDENGKIEINNINIGDYILRETKTNNGYELKIDNDMAVIVNWDITTELIVINEKIKIEKEIELPRDEVSIEVISDVDIIYEPENSIIQLKTQEKLPKTGF